MEYPLFGGGFHGGPLILGRLKCDRPGSREASASKNRVKCVLSYPDIGKDLKQNFSN